MVHQIKNRAPAQIQITAEQILLEAQERQIEEKTAPRQRVTDQEELEDFQMRKRKEFEDQIRRQRQFIGNWLKYAKWEESQKQFARARSVYERVLDVDHREHKIWLNYAEVSHDALR